MSVDSELGNLNGVVRRLFGLELEGVFRTVYLIRTTGLRRL